MPNLKQQLHWLVSSINKVKMSRKFPNLVLERRHYFLGIFGIIVIVIGLSLYVEREYIYFGKIDKLTAFSPSNKEFYENWKNPTFPIYLTLYIFNCTNALNVTYNHEKPNFTELGPYVFRERLIKENVKWNPNSTVSYSLNRTWIFCPELSNGTMDDEITNINVPIATMAAIIRDAPHLLRVVLSATLQAMKERLFVTHTMKELIFEGYRSPFIHSINERLDVFPEDKFAWLYKKNNSADNYTVFTGGNGTPKGSIDLWNGLRQIDAWKGDCGLIKGTTLDILPSKLKKEDPITFFVQEIRRSLSFDFLTEENVEGILGYKYIPTSKLFANSEDNPSNYCFETSENTPSGLMDESLVYDAPIFVSFPHFYKADPSLLNSVNGLDPDPQKHGSEVVVEPDSGIPLSLQINLQYNVFVKNDRFVDIFRNVQSTYFPVFWIYHGAYIDDKTARELRIATVVVKNLIYISPLALLILGVILILTIFWDIFKWQFKTESSECVSIANAQMEKYH